MPILIKRDDGKLMLDDVEIKSVEILSDESQIETTLMDEDKKLREALPSYDRFPDTELDLTSDGIRVRKIHSVQPAVAKADVPTLKASAEKLGVEWKDGHEDRVILYHVSDQDPDRHGDIVLQDWDFSVFKTNPAMPWCHNWDAPPIGAHLMWEVGKSDQGPTLYTHSMFATEDTYPFADQMYRLAKAGMLRGISPGFYPSEVIVVRDKAERQKLGLGEHGSIFGKNLLVESSPCLMPAGANAYAVMNSALSSGKLKASDHVAVRELRRLEVQRGRGDSKRWREVEASVLAAWKTFFPDEKVEAHSDLDVPVYAPTKQDSALWEKMVEMAASIEGLKSSIDGMHRELWDATSRIWDRLDEIAPRYNADENEEPEFDLGLITQASQRLEAMTKRLNGV